MEFRNEINKTEERLTFVSYHRHAQMIGNYCLLLEFALFNSLNLCIIEQLQPLDLAK